MPWAMKRIADGKSKGKYRVINTETGEVHSKASSKANAERQLNLLRAVKHGWKPTGAPARK